MKLQENRYPVQSKPLTIQLIPYRLSSFPYSISYYNTSFTYRYPPKQTTYSRVSLRNKLRANPTKSNSKTPRSRRHEQSIPPIMKNERYSPNTPTETRTIPARTQKAKQNSELGINDSTGYRNPKLSQTRGSRYAPPQRIPKGVRRGVGEG